MPLGRKDFRAIRSAQRWRDPEYWPFAIKGEAVKTEIPNPVWFHETFDLWRPDDLSNIFHETFDNSVGSVDDLFHETFSDYSPPTVGPFNAILRYYICKVDSNGHHYKVNAERSISVTVRLEQSDGSTVWSDSTPAAYDKAPTHIGNPWTLTLPANYTTFSFPVPFSSWESASADLSGSTSTINFDPSTRLYGTAIYDARPYYDPDFCTD